jgi:ferredoxin
MGDHSAGFRRDSIARNLASDAVVGGDAGASDKGDDNVDADESIDTSMDPRLFRVRLSRAAGIEWGTDLSFSFVYIRTMEPAGAADLSGELEVGDQLCELRPVLGQGADEKAAPVPLVGAPFDMVMNAFATLSNDVREIDLVFFRGTKDELKSLASGGGGKPEADTITITVVQDKGSAQEQVRTIRAPTGCNVREVLIEEGINVYQSVTRWTNCKGKQLCGTCIVNMAAGGLDTNRKSMDEASTLRENPESYRLSCVTFAYGDVTVETFPPIKAAQWTR